MHRSASILVLALLATACGTLPLGEDPSALPDPPDAVDPDRVTNLSCNGRGFPASLLDGPGGAELGADPAAAALRAHLTDPAMAIETEFLPREGWREAYRDADSVLFVAPLPPEPDGGASLATVSADRTGGSWRVIGWGGCQVRADIGPGLGAADFRIAPGQVLGPDTTEIDVLVSERDCNSGEDARGRIVQPAVIEGDDTVTVILGVRPRGGIQSCPSNPETPFRLALPSPLGARALLDGAVVPARDATTCPPTAWCQDPAGSMGG